MTDELRMAYGMGTFSRVVKLDRPTIRTLCDSGVLNPIVTDSGWRAFSTEDIARAKEWRRNRSSARGAG